MGKKPTRRNIWKKHTFPESLENSFFACEIYKNRELPIMSIEIQDAILILNNMNFNKKGLMMQKQSNQTIKSKKAKRTNGFLLFWMYYAQFISTPLSRSIIVKMFAKIWKTYPSKAFWIRSAEEYDLLSLPQESCVSWLTSRQQKNESHKNMTEELWGGFIQEYELLSFPQDINISLSSFHQYQRGISNSDHGQTSWFNQSLDAEFTVLEMPSLSESEKDYPTFTKIECYSNLSPLTTTTEFSDDLDLSSTSSAIASPDFKDSSNLSTMTIGTYLSEDFYELLPY